MSVQLIKVRDLSGRRVKLEPGVFTVRGTRPVWFRVDSVMNSAGQGNVGRYFYLLGSFVRSDGTPTTSPQRRKIHSVWIAPREILTVV